MYGCDGVQSESIVADISIVASRAVDLWMVIRQRWCFFESECGYRRRRRSVSDLVSLGISATDLSRDRCKSRK